MYKSFTTLTQFVVCHLWPGEMVEVFLAELCRLAVLFGGMSEEGLQCAFIAGLLEHAKQLIQVSSQIEDLDLPQVLAQARATLKNFTGSVEQVAVAAQPPHCTPRGIDMQTRCYECDGPNYWASYCLLRHETSKSADAYLQRTIACY